MLVRIALAVPLCLLFVGASAALAADPPVPIEGRMLVSANEWGVGTYTYFIEGMSDNRSVPGPDFLYGELSLDKERVAYHTAGAAPAATADVWIARLDGHYHPQYAVDRDQMAVYVARAFGLVS